MKIIQIVQKPQWRGAEIFARQLSQTLRKLAHHVRTVYLYPHIGQTSSFATRQTEKPFPLHADDMCLNGNENHFFEKMPGINPFLLLQLINQIEQFQPRVIQVNGARTIKYGTFAKRLTRHKAWVLIYRNIDNPRYWVRDPFRRFFYRKLVMPKVDGVIGVSENTLESVKSVHQFKAQAVYIPNGIDVAPLQNAKSLDDIPADKKVVLFMGNLTRQKRPDRFLRVIKQVHTQYSNMEAWMLGDGVLRETMEKQAHDLGIAHVVRFLGYQDHIASYIARANMLLVTSDSDGIPAVILEAGYLRKPTIACRVGGIPECVRHGETGILKSPDDEAGLAQAVLDLFENQERQTYLGDNARTWVETHFTMDNVARRYFKFYQQVLENVKLPQD